VDYFYTATTRRLRGAMWSIFTPALTYIVPPAEEVLDAFWKASRVCTRNEVSKIAI
jgi:hypothetical protein